MPSPFTLLTVLLTGGLLLLLAGLWGKRVGTEPRCRKCKYNLTGLTANRCSECGAWVDARAVRYGLRHRRWPALGCGLGLLLLGGAGAGTLMYGKAQQIDWYQHYPFRLLLAYAGADDKAALDELLARLEQNQIAAASIPRLAELALARHGLHPPPPHASQWCRLSEMLYLLDVYTDAQREHFCRNFTTVRLQVRPRLRVGDPLIGRLDYPERASWRVFGTFRQQEILLDGEPYQKLQDYFVSRRGTLANGGYVLDPTSLDLKLEPGSHTLAYHATCAVEPYANLYAPNEWPAEWTGETSATAQVEVVPLTGADPIRLVPDAEVADQLQRTLTIPYALLTRKYPDYDLLGTKFELHQPVELDLAFEVLLLSQGKEVRLGYVSWSRGDCGPIILPPHASAETESEVLGDELDLLLRASRTAAARSLSCYEIWNGELRLESVPIQFMH